MPLLVHAVVYSRNMSHAMSKTTNRHAAYAFESLTISYSSDSQELDFLLAHGLSLQ